MQQSCKKKNMLNFGETCWTAENRSSLSCSGFLVVKTKNCNTPPPPPPAPQKCHKKCCKTVVVVVVQGVDTALLQAPLPQPAGLHQHHRHGHCLHCHQLNQAQVRKLDFKKRKTSCKRLSRFFMNVNTFFVETFSRKQRSGNF